MTIKTSWGEITAERDIISHLWIMATNAQDSSYITTEKMEEYELITNEIGAALFKDRRRNK